MRIIFKSSIGTSIILMILGFLLIFQSEATIATISYIAGAILIAAGVFALIRFVKNSKEAITTLSLDILYGIVTVILGVIVIMNPHAIASILPIVLGIAIIINSASKLQYAFVLRNDNNNLWKATMTIAIISTICGVVLLFNPFAGAVLIMKIVGIFILSYSVLDIVSTAIIKKNVDEFKSGIDSSNIGEAEIVEEDKKGDTHKKKKKK
ncbi:MAG: hypothetical protein HFJ12_02510 [Bacilli bacterium]|nr:hypothetical protein [Bacilli bacterium]